MAKKIFLITGILAAALLAAVWFAARPSFDVSAPVQLVKIPKGLSAGQVASLLEEKNIVHSRSFFLSLARLTPRGLAFRQGTYQFQPNRYWNILRKLQTGQTYKIKVTLPEGWSAFQMAERLIAEGVLTDPEIFLSAVEAEALEGFLFPDTYFFEPDTEPRLILDAMTQLFRRNFSAEMEARARQLKMTERQVVTLASIIEREAQVESERPLIASVYHNRLKKNMPLAADPTIQYALAKGRSWKERILYKDLNVGSPYNTYKRPGLPPGPICSPGLKSIQAALTPAETPYLFFVANDQGGHFFSASYREHMQRQKDMRMQKRKKKN